MSVKIFIRYVPSNEKQWSTAEVTPKQYLDAVKTGRLNKLLHIDAIGVMSSCLIWFHKEQVWTV